MKVHRVRKAQPLDGGKTPHYFIELTKNSLLCE